MDTALAQKFSFILDRNLAKANCTGNRVCTSCDAVVLVLYIINFILLFVHMLSYNQLASCIILLTKLKLRHFANILCSLAGH